MEPYLAMHDGRARPRIQASRFHRKTWMSILSGLITVAVIIVCGSVFLDSPESHLVKRAPLRSTLSSAWTGYNKKFLQFSDLGKDVMGLMETSDTAKMQKQMKKLRLHGYAKPVHLTSKQLEASDNGWRSTVDYFTIGDSHDGRGSIPIGKVLKSFKLDVEKSGKMVTWHQDLPYKVNGIERNATNGNYSNVYDTKEGVLVLDHYASPWGAISKMKEKDKQPPPEVHLWTDITAVEWEKQAEANHVPPQGLNYVFSVKNSNEDDISIATQILQHKSKAKLAPSWSRLPIDPKSKEGRAILGSPSLFEVGMMLVQNRELFGMKTVESIDMLREDGSDPKKMSSVSYMLRLKNYEGGKMSKLIEKLQGKHHATSATMKVKTSKDSNENNNHRAREPGLTLDRIVDHPTGDLEKLDSNYMIVPRGTIIALVSASGLMIGLILILLAQYFDPTKINILSNHSATKDTFSRDETPSRSLSKHKLAALVTMLTIVLLLAVGTLRGCADSSVAAPPDASSMAKREYEGSWTFDKFVESGELLYNMMLAEDSDKMQQFNKDGLFHGEDPHTQYDSHATEVGWLAYSIHPHVNYIEDIIPPVMSIMKGIGKESFNDHAARYIWRHERKYMIGGKEFEPTHSIVDATYDAQAGVIVEQFGNSTIGRKPDANWPDIFREDQISAIQYNRLAHDNQTDPKKFEYLVYPACYETGVASEIVYNEIMTQAGHTEKVTDRHGNQTIAAVPWPGVEVKTTTREGKAALRAACGFYGVQLAVNHRKIFGHKIIDSIRIVHDDASADKPFYGPTWIMHFRDYDPAIDGTPSISTVLTSASSISTSSISASSSSTSSTSTSSSSAFSVSAASIFTRSSTSSPIATSSSLTTSASTSSTSPTSSSTSSSSTTSSSTSLALTTLASVIPASVASSSTTLSSTTSIPASAGPSETSPIPTKKRSDSTTAIDSSTSEEAAHGIEGRDAGWDDVHLFPDSSGEVETAFKTGVEKIEDTAANVSVGDDDGSSTSTSTTTSSFILSTSTSSASTDSTPTTSASALPETLSQPRDRSPMSKRAVPCVGDSCGVAPETQPPCSCLCGNNGARTEKMCELMYSSAGDVYRRSETTCPGRCMSEVIGFAIQNSLKSGSADLVVGVQGKKSDGSSFSVLTGTFSTSITSTSSTSASPTPYVAQPQDCHMEGNAWTCEPDDYHPKALSDNTKDCHIDGNKYICESY